MILSTHTVCDKARKRVWTQDVELTVGQHESSLSHREGAITQLAATWIHAATACWREETSYIKELILCTVIKHISEKMP